MVLKRASRNQNGGFTMIELMMTMAVMAIMGSLALTQFLDFGKDAKAGAVRNSLATLRIGVKNQRQQAMLRCNRTVASIISAGTMYADFITNDITNVVGAAPGICNATQLPNAADRKFISTGGAMATTYYNGVKDGNLGLVDPTVQLPANALISPKDFTLVSYAQPIDVTVNPGGYGLGACAWANYFASSGVQYHWLYDPNTQEVYSGTNTTGIQECSY